MTTPYLDHLVRDILPWWAEHGPDTERGGVWSCWDNTGEVRVSTDKYTWSQGRWVWLASAVAGAAGDGWLPVDPEPWRRTAVATARYVAEHAMLPDGSTAYVTRTDGTPYEPVPGQGLHTSIFADCFVALGWARLGALGADPSTDWAGRAEALLVSVADRIAARDETPVRTDPYPVPSGYGSFALPMITLGVATEVHRANGSAVAAALARGAADELASTYLEGDDAIEMPVTGPEGDPESLFATHRTPGHLLECLWFLDDARPLLTGHTLADPARLTALANHALGIGWDPEHGGLLRYVDRSGGEPRSHRESTGVVPLAGTNPYDDLVRRTWDTKLWWIHAEATLTCELLLSRTQDPVLRTWRDRVRDWTTSTFPAGPGREWLQNRDRTGQPITETVALPVKDPMHIARAWLRLADLERQGQIVS